MIRQPHHDAFPQHAAHRVLNCVTGVLVDDPEDLAERSLQGFVRAPTGQRLRHGVEEIHAPLGIGDDHCIADAGECCLPAFAQHALSGFGLA